jgi:two-component system sensor histidine kinase TctE
VQYEAIEVVVYRLRKKLAHTGVTLMTLRGLGYLLKGRRHDRPGTPARPLSLRRYLLLGILLPIGLFVVINTVSLYRQALDAVNVAYDRTLLASAKSIGELLDVRATTTRAQLRVTVPYAALEAFEADNQSRMYYRVSGLGGEMVSGFADLPVWRGACPTAAPTPRWWTFTTTRFRGEPVRVAVLLQPVASANGRGMAVIQVAETLELRAGAGAPAC